MRIFNTLLILGILLTANASSQNNGESSASMRQQFIGVPDELISKTSVFFDNIIKLEIVKAFDGILADSPLSEKKEARKQLISQTKKAMEIYGNLKGYEAVSSEMISASYIRLRFLGLHENYPMRWIFTFYNSPELGWIVTNIKFDDLSEFYFTDE
jgi:hypothetical protein